MMMQVNANGVISFRCPFADFTTMQFPLLSMAAIVAPFWANINIERGGEIFFRSSRDSSLLREVRERIGGSSDFHPDVVFIATWDRVAPISTPFNPNPTEVNLLKQLLPSPK
jgi:hypothetical protein